MQLNDLQELVGRLKENRDMQVETTTLGRFLGTDSARLALVLGKEILNRPVIVSTRESETQILDLNSGFVVSFSNVDEVLPKLMQTFSNGAQKAKMAEKVTSVEKTEHLYKRVLEREMHSSSMRAELCECKSVIYKPGSIDDRVALVEKTIKLLDKHKLACDESERGRVEKAQGKLGKLITHVRSNKLAPGQVPSVYELAVWEWVKG